MDAVTFAVVDAVLERNAIVAELTTARDDGNVSAQIQRAHAAHRAAAALGAWRSLWPMVKA